MEPLTLGTMINVLRNGLKTNRSQKSAGFLLLDAIIRQEMTAESVGIIQIDERRISQIANGKCQVPNGLDLASQIPEVRKAVLEYFRERVLPDMNSFTGSDALQRLAKIIEDDTTIADEKRAELMEYFQQKDIARFLSEVFLYALNRPNKKDEDHIQTEEILYLDEVSYRCPVCGARLIERKKEVALKRFEIVKIDSNKEGQSFDNTIALCGSCAEEFRIGTTFKEIQQMKVRKDTLRKRNEASLKVDEIKLERDIREVVDRLAALKDETEMQELSYDALRIDQKIHGNVFLRTQIAGFVTKYYRYIERLFKEQGCDFTMIALQVQQASRTLERSGLEQEQIVHRLVTWICHKVMLNEDYSLACMALVAFFIQNCEIFREVGQDETAE